MTEAVSHENLRDDIINIQPDAAKMTQEEKDEDEDPEASISKLLLDTLVIKNPHISFSRVSTHKETKDENTSRSDDTRNEDNDLDSDTESDDDDDIDNDVFNEEKKACLDRMLQKVTDASSVRHSRYSNDLADKEQV